MSLFHQKWPHLEKFSSQEYLYKFYYLLSTYCKGTKKFLCSIEKVLKNMSSLPDLWSSGKKRHLRLSSIFDDSFVFSGGFISRGPLWTAWVGSTRRRRDTDRNAVSFYGNMTSTRTWSARRRERKRSHLNWDAGVTTTRRPGAPSYRSETSWEWTLWGQWKYRGKQEFSGTVFGNLVLFVVLCRSSPLSPTAL